MLKFETVWTLKRGEVDPPEALSELENLRVNHAMYDQEAQVHYRKPQWMLDLENLSNGKEYPRAIVGSEQKSEITNVKTNQLAACTANGRPCPNPSEGER